MATLAEVAEQQKALHSDIELENLIRRLIGLMKVDCVKSKYIPNRRAAVFLLAGQTKLHYLSDALGQTMPKERIRSFTYWKDEYKPAVTFLWELQHSQYISIKEKFMTNILSRYRNDF